MNVVIIKYNAGNVQSVIYALERLGVSSVLTDDPDLIRSADKVIFPGQGEASSAMEYLKERKLDKLIIDLKQPVLGICIGLQLMCKYSEEGATECLGIFDLQVKKFDLSKDMEQSKIKVPHMGWNRLTHCKTGLFEGLSDPYVYYVHSYYAETGEGIIGTTKYSIPFSGALNKNNFFAVQAHIEKSGNDGQKILSNFINYKS